MLKISNANLSDQHIISAYQATLAGNMSFAEKYNEKVDEHLSNILSKFLNVVDLSKEYVIFVALINGDDKDTVLNEYSENIKFLKHATSVHRFVKQSFYKDVFWYTSSKMCGRYMIEHNYGERFLIISIRDERRILIIDKDEIK